LLIVALAIGVIIVLIVLLYEMDQRH